MGLTSDLDINMFFNDGYNDYGDDGVDDFRIKTLCT